MRSQTWPYCPRPAALADVLALRLDLAGDGLAVGDLRLADVGVDLVLAPHAVDDDVQVELAHAGDHGLAGLSSVRIGTTDPPSAG